MKKYIIVKIDDVDWYTLKDETGQKNEIGITFYHGEPLPCVGDYIHLSEKLFDVKANEGIRNFHFGGLSEEYGRKILAKDVELANEFMDSPTSYNNTINDELLAFERNNERIILKRFYG